MASSISEEISTPSAADELVAGPMSPDAAETTKPRVRGFRPQSAGIADRRADSWAPVRICPRTIVRNEDLARLGCDADWIIQRTGIRERRHAAPHQATSDLAYEAAVRCLDNAGVASRDVDLILVATMTPDMLTPSTACIGAASIGGGRAGHGSQRGLFRFHVRAGDRHAVHQDRLQSARAGDRQ